MTSRPPLNLDDLARQTRNGNGAKRSAREDRVANELAEAYEKLAAAQRRQSERG